MKRALAIPNFTDPVELRKLKWQEVLKEPEQAAFLRDNGLLVNPYYEIRRLSVDSEAIDTLAMAPFSTLPFDVYDGKDTSRTRSEGPLSHIENYKNLRPVISGISKDIKKLAELRVMLEPDSISFAVMPDGEMRLFLFDFERMLMKNDSEGLEKWHAWIVVNKLNNLFDFEQGKQFERQGYNPQKLADDLIAN
jgi:hypothetical protein